MNYPVSSGHDVPVVPAAGSCPEELDAVTAAPDHHALMFENAAMRVLDTRDAQGQVLLDSCMVPELAASPGVLWSAPLPAHSLENVGETDLRVIRVELKQAAA
jgi:hypothetical protein